MNKILLTLFTSAALASAAQAAPKYNCKAQVGTDTYDELLARYDTHNDDAYTLESFDELDAILQQQILAAADAKTAKKAFLNDDKTIYTISFSAEDLPADSYRVLYFYQGDTLVGAIFDADGTQPVARIGDGDLYDCDFGV